MSNTTFFKGVNLGGWLVLEQWITPHLFDGTAAEDEYSLLLQKGTDAAAFLQPHRKKFITRTDLEWLKDRGINAIRFPIGYWLFGGYSPFVACDEFVTWLLDNASELNLSVLLDIHAVPGSQNGWDHSGRKGSVRWHTNKENLYQSVQLLHQISEKYASHPAVWGIEVLNEPRWDVPHKILVEYYQQAYTVIRQYSDSTAVVFHDAFRPLSWGSFFHNLHGTEVYLDMHHYQCFDWRDKHLTINGHLDKLHNTVTPLILEVQHTVPVLIGEWSLGLDRRSLKGFNENEVLQVYAKVQQEVFAQTHGWFFWTYKTANMPGWSLRDAVTHNWLQVDN